jgi:acyl-CoA synthetase (AMP-forming)/AMP-acid ligase II
MITALAQARERHGERIAVSEHGRSISYAQLDDLVSARAEALGELPHRVGIHAENSIDYVVSYFALLRKKKVPFLVDAAFGPRELGEIHTGCGVNAFLVDRTRSAAFPLGGSVTQVAGSAHDVVVLQEVAGGPALHRDTAVCRFTSGTTASPKCLEFSADAVTNAARNWVAGAGLSTQDSTLCLAVLTNGLAFNTSLLASFLVGARLHLFRGLPTSNRILRALADSQATRLVAFPAVYRMLTESQVPADAFTALRMAISAGAALPSAVRTEFEARFNVRVADYYGVAELGPCTFERDASYRSGLGTALPGVLVRTVEETAGQLEIRVSSNSGATRYLNAPGALQARYDEDGYYRTGDLGYLHEQRLYVTGRVGGPINLAGRKIDPNEIEHAVREIAGVSDAAVFADAAGNQTLVHLAVVATGLVRADIVAGCRARLAHYKIPQKVTFVPLIPRSSKGLVRLPELRRLAQEGKP